jgi:hypothetical protein
MNAQVNDNEKAVNKIRKLLAHATDSAAGSEHERDNAMRMALKLLAKHNLTMADVEEEKEDRDMVFMEQFPDPYRRVIANAIAEMYFCKFYHVKVPNKQKLNFHFVGLESNCNTALEMTKYVIKSVSDESNLKQREAGAGAGWGTTFRNAACARIAERCREFRAEAEAESAVESQSTGTALVLANLYETEKEANTSYIVKILNVKLTEKKTTLVNKSRSANAQGREFGDKVNLSNQIASNAQQPAAPVAGLIK